MIRETAAIGVVMGVVAITAVGGQHRAQNAKVAEGYSLVSDAAQWTPTAQQTPFDGPPWLNGCSQENEVKVTYIDGHSRCFAADDLRLED